MQKHVTSASLLNTEDTTSPVLLPEEFAHHIQHCREAGYRLAYSLLGHAQDAEDAVQEAVVRAWAAREEYDRTVGAFKAWFLGIVHHRATDVARHRGLEQRYAASKGDQDALCLQLPDLARTPDAVAVYKESWHALSDAVQRLPLKIRLVVVLHYGEGMKCDEVASRLEIEPVTVRTRLSRAYKLLRQQLAEVQWELLQSV